MTISDVLDEARARGDDVRLAAFGAVAAKEEVRLAQLLSLTLGVSRGEIERLAEELWGMRDALLSLDRLIRWPFVEDDGEHLSIAPALAGPLAEQFRQTSPNLFVQAHCALAALEEASETDDRDGAWFIRGRIAFYLAGADPDRSIDQFTDCFTNPPILDRTVCRMWLTSLVLRQQRLLEERRRELAFYRGFRAYVVGHRDEARAAFEEVTGDRDADMYQAIASHLLGVIVRPQDAARAESLLRESIGLSQELALFDNEVMARHSTVWALVEKARAATEPDRRTIMLAAREQAVIALDLARSASDDFLIAWCTRSAVAMEWAVLTSEGKTVTAEALSEIDGLVVQLTEAQSLALVGGDFESFVYLCNEAALIYRDGGRFEEALSQIDLAMKSVAGFDLRAFEKLAKTTRSILVRGRNAGISERAQRLLRRMSARHT